MGRRRDVLLLGTALAALAASVGCWFVPERWQQWVLFGVTVWLALSVLVSVAVGRMVRLREERDDRDDLHDAEALAVAGGRGDVDMLMQMLGDADTTERAGQ